MNIISYTNGKRSDNKYAMSYELTPVFPSVTFKLRGFARLVIECLCVFLTLIIPYVILIMFS